MLQKRRAIRTRFLFDGAAVEVGAVPVTALPVAPAAVIPIRRARSTQHRRRAAAQLTEQLPARLAGAQVIYAAPAAAPRRRRRR